MEYLACDLRRNDWQGDGKRLLDDPPVACHRCVFCVAEHQPHIQMVKNENCQLTRVSLKYAHLWIAVLSFHSWARFSPREKIIRLRDARTFVDEISFICGRGSHEGEDQQV